MHLVTLYHTALVKQSERTAMLAKKKIEVEEAGFDVEAVQVQWQQYDQKTRLEQLPAIDSAEAETNLAAATALLTTSTRQVAEGQVCLVRARAAADNLQSLLSQTEEAASSAAAAGAAAAVAAADALRAGRFGSAAELVAAGGAPAAAYALANAEADAAAVAAAAAAAAVATARDEWARSKRQAQLCEADVQRLRHAEAQARESVSAAEAPVADRLASLVLHTLVAQNKAPDLLVYSGKGEELLEDEGAREGDQVPQ